jgi:hypothetical protein
MVTNKCSRKRGSAQPTRRCGMHPRGQRCFAAALLQCERTKHEGESRVSNLCKSHKATNMGPLRHVACESGSLLGESVQNILGHIHDHCRRRC